MNVMRAVQIFSPTVTATLRYLQESEDCRFQRVDATITFMKHMHYFFQIHNVSNRTYYIRSLDSSIAPYVDVSDERLEWLHVTFPNYIDDIQHISVTAGMKGLSQETAHALKFTAESMCIKFLLSQAGFYYVLTRAFSSDAVEATFSHVRLRGGSNDATDGRAAEYAMRQILRCGIVKTSKSSNTASTVNYVSHAFVQNLNSRTDTEDLILPMELKIKIFNLCKDIVPRADIYSASVAFLAGYIIKKIDDKFHCDDCLSPLLSFELPGPLLKLIFLQDRGGLTYPNSRFVGVVKQISDIALKMFPLLKFERACEQLLNIIFPHLEKNPLFKCEKHKRLVCKFVVTTTVKPVLDNICLETTDLVKAKLLQHKPVSRKVLKL
ncbi:hypothetical protein Zmor_011679 [Zophobas morio]|uniref:Transposable element P transposase-like GTP-binding insertion domain-containing protein n=1 Tax=Zophobas morio TaxID=2755281 RepID=A0AA38MLD6_9CUCU|nr:hypothetical protein Zmor_011679 [Zophobas morio]